AQGRVNPTTTVGGMVINDNAGLEKEADVLGAKALQMKPKENKSRAITTSAVQKKSSTKQGFGFVDNRPEVAVQRKFQDMANKTATLELHSMSVIQMGKKKNKKAKEEPITVSRPSHTQEEIQDEMIKLWQIHAINEQDQLRADYAWNYRGIEGGWCDGWSYVLSMGGDELAEIWSEIDSLLDGGNQLNSTSKYNACALARKASLYHIMNQDPPETGIQQEKDYKAANFEVEQTPANRESWNHDEDSTLKMYVIKEEIKSLEDGQTLRLTSPIHDAAVQRIKGGYIVSETESHGVQKCEKLEEAMLILGEWREECEQKNDPFFNQTMIV
ncbi:hypothetical protein L2764_27145, partial [Shewanella surugensis]|nr:hypothetical protein [Shewanella surugensis]